MPAQSIVDLLAETARHTRTIMARHLLATGLYAGQENVIELLHQNGSLTPGQLAAQLHVKPTTMTKTLSRMESQGLLRRTTSANDGRIIEVTLSDKGASIVETIAAAKKAAEAEAMSALKKKQKRALAELLALLNAELTGTLPSKTTKKTKPTNKKSST